MDEVVDAKKVYDKIVDSIESDKALAKDGDAWAAKCQEYNDLMKDKIIENLESGAPLSPLVCGYLGAIGSFVGVVVELMNTQNATAGEMFETGMLGTFRAFVKDLELEQGIELERKIGAFELFLHAKVGNA